MGIWVPSSSNVTSYVLARSDIPYDGEVRLGERLMIAAELIVTILVHGSAAICVALALTTANPWLRRAMVTAVGLTALGALAMRSLLAPLVSRTSFSAVETLWSVALWDVVVTMFAIALSWWTIWAWQRRVSGVASAEPSLVSATLS